MLKLYKRIDNALHYHEAWLGRVSITEHWGVVGEQGETRDHKRNKRLEEKHQLEQVLGKARAAGFRPIEPEDQTKLLIEYAVEGMGTRTDLDKRHALQDRLDEVLGWAGLGNCDGGSMGSGTMETCCYVVDFDVAKRVIAADLRDTEFGDYTRIYDESVGPPPTLTTPEPGTGMLAPPWVMHGDLAPSDPSWQSGKPGEYLTTWTNWYCSTPAQAQSTYQTIFREPEEWSGFYRSIVS